MLLRVSVSDADHARPGGNPASQVFREHDTLAQTEAGDTRGIGRRDPGGGED